MTVYELYSGISQILRTLKLSKTYDRISCIQDLQDMKNRIEKENKEWTIEQEKEAEDDPALSAEKDLKKIGKEDLGNQNLAMQQ